MKLLDEKELSKITVTDIVKTAEINRSTFYAHYQDIFDLYDDLMQSIINRNLEVLEKAEHSNMLENPKVYLNALSENMEEYRHLYQKLGHSEHMHRVLDLFRQRIAADVVKGNMLPEAALTEPQLSVRVNFFVGGVMNTYQQWIEGKLSCSLDEINAEIADLISKSASDLL